MNFRNQSTFVEITNRNQVACYFLRHSVLPLIRKNWAVFWRYTRLCRGSWRGLLNSNHRNWRRSLGQMLSH